jgi:hypothetical protein
LITELHRGRRRSALAEGVLRLRRAIRRRSLPRGWLFVQAGVAAVILSFYVSRLLMPLPLFAVDEAAYLIRALYPDAIVARNPWVPAINNQVHFSVIRASYDTGLPFIVADRIADGFAYLAGLLLLWRACTRDMRPSHQAVALLTAISFPYYRFAFSNLAEGLYVGALALVCLATGRWYQSRPRLHAVLTGALAAGLVLVKPHGVAIVAALIAVGLADAAVSRRWRRLALRALLFGAVFFLAGNAIQVWAGEPPAHWFTFFIGGFYEHVVGMPLSAGSLRLGVLEFLCMASAVAVLAGPPIVLGLWDLLGRWRCRGEQFRMDGSPLVLLLLIVSLMVTLAMVAVFSMKIAADPGETYRLWGRYFEFFVPMLWLAAAPALAKIPNKRAAWLCAATMAAGLLGLALSFRAGIVLFPWDATILLAFFHADPVRAPLGVVTPYRVLAFSATVLASVALALRVRPLHVGLALLLTLAALSADLDHVWLGPMIRQRTALERDIRAAAGMVPLRSDKVALAATDPNEADLGFLRFNAIPYVLTSPPAQLQPAELARFDTVLIVGSNAHPPGPWSEVYTGDRLSVFRRAPNKAQ